MWYSGADQDWADVKLTRERRRARGREPTRSSGCGTTTSSRQDWDFGFVEVSTDGGTTWTEQKVYDEAGTEVSTAGRLRRPQRPHGRLRRQEVRPDRRHRRLAARLRRPRRLRRAAPSRCGCARPPTPAFLERGWFADDFSLTGGGADRCGATTSRAATTTAGPLTTGTCTNTVRRGLAQRQRHAGQGAVLPGRVAQLRRLRQGPAVRLRHDVRSTGTRDRRRLEGREDQVQRPRRAGLVPRHDLRQRQLVAPTTSTALPSSAAKGGLLIVDSHFDPLRRSGANAALGPVDAEEPAVPPAVLERRVRPRADQGVQRSARRNGRTSARYCNTFAAAGAR